MLLWVTCAQTNVFFMRHVRTLIVANHESARHGNSSFLRYGNASGRFSPALYVAAAVPPQFSSLDAVTASRNRSPTTGHTPPQLCFLVNGLLRPRFRRTLRVLKRERAVLMLSSCKTCARSKVNTSACSPEGESKSSPRRRVAFRRANVYLPRAIGHDVSSQDGAFRETAQAR